MGDVQRIAGNGRRLPRQARRKVNLTQGQTAEQQEKQERMGAMLTKFMAECAAEYDDAASNAPASEPVAEYVEVAERRFDRHLTAAGRDLAKEWGILL